MVTNSNGFRLTKSIGSPWNVEADDVLKTKTVLKKTGDHKKPAWGVTGYPNQDMFAGLRAFQKREGAQVDGVKKPGGTTEKRRAQKMKPPAQLAPLPVQWNPVSRRFGIKTGGDRSLTFDSAS